MHIKILKLSQFLKNLKIKKIHINIKYYKDITHAQIF